MRNSSVEKGQGSLGWVKKLLIITVAILLLVVTLVAAALTFIESPPGREWLTDQASERLGRQVTLTDIDIDYGRVAAIRLTGLAVDNPNWATEPKMLQLDSLLFRIRLLPLLRGKLVFERIAADNPVVNLQRRADGSSSWQFGDGGAKPASEKTDSLQLPRIETLRLNGGAVNYNDVPLETQLALRFGTNVETAMADDTVAVDGPNSLTASGELQLSGRRLQINLRAGSPTRALNSSDTGVTYPADLHISGDTVDVRMSGTIDALLQPRKAELEFSLKGDDLQSWNEIALLSADTPLLPAIEQYSATATLRAEYGKWHVDYLQLEADGNRLQGELHADSNARPLSISAKLQVGPLDVARIQSWLPESGPSQPLDETLAAQLQQLAELPIDAKLQVSASDITMEPRQIDDLQLNARLKKGRLTVNELAVQASGSSVTASGFINSRSKPAKGKVKLIFEGLRPTRIAAETGNAGAVPEPLAGRLRGELEALFAASRVETAPAQPAASANSTAAATPAKLQLTSLSLPVSTLHFRDGDYDSDVSLKLQISELTERRNSATEVRLNADGRWRGEPLQVGIDLDGLPNLKAIMAMMEGSTDPAAPAKLAVNAELGRSTLSVNGNLNSAWPPLPKNLDLAFESPAPADTAEAFGASIPTVEPLLIRAQLTQTEAMKWLLQLPTASMGENNLAGEARIGVRDDGGVNLQAQFNSPRFDISSLQSPEAGLSSEPVATKSDNDSAASNATAFNAPDWLKSLDGRLQFNIKELVLPRSQLGELEMVLLFERGTVRLQPLKFPLGGGNINATGVVDITVPGLAGELDADINTVDVGEVVQQFGEPKGDDGAATLGTLDGRVELRLAEAGDIQQRALTLDGIGDRLRIQEVRLKYDDPNLGASTDLRIRADSLNSGLTVDGTINYRERPVQLTLNTGSLRQAIDAPKSLPIDATLVNQDTSIKLDGTVGSLLPFEQLQAKVELKGPGTADLGEWFDIPLPDLPPYDVRARVKRSIPAAGLDRVELSNLRGTVGDSDLSGDLTVTIGGAKPDIKGELQSELLDFDDLAGLIGAAPDPDETASAEQQQQAEIKARSEKLLPRMPLNFGALQRVNADVKYRAKSVLAPNLPMNSFAMDMTLADGHLKMPRLDFGLAEGAATLQLEINANKSPTSSKISGNFDGVRLNNLLENIESANDAAGTVGGSISLWMQGSSLAEWFGSADGGSYLTMTGGQIDALLVELAGLDIGESLALFFGSETEVAIDCAYVDLQARDGTVTLKPILLDTSDTHFVGEGSIELKQETMDITINPYPKDFTLLSSRGPLKIGGTFKDPGFGVRPSLPLPELGLSEGSARCDGLVTELRGARKDNNSN